MPHHCNLLRLGFGQRLSIIISLCALASFLSIMPCALGYSETINMPVSALSFNSSFLPAGSSLDQVLGFYNGDPLVNKYSVALQDGIEVYASASTPTSLGGRPNVNSSGSLMATVVGTTPFSYLEWSLIGQSQSIISAHPPDASLGSIAHGFTVSGRRVSGGSSCSFLGPSVWASADYWYPNSEIFTDCALVKVRLTFASLQVKLYRTEVTVSCAPVSGVAPQQVAFSASAEEGVAPYAFLWDFAGLGTSNQQNPAFTFEAPGTYTVRCTATDSLGVSDTKSINVSVSSFRLDISSQGGGCTSPPSGSYDMRRGDQAVVSAMPSSGFVHDGWLLDGFMVGNANPITVVMNSNHTLKAIFVEALSVSAWASPMTGVAPLAVTFSSVADGGTPPYSYSWSFGDGGASDLQNCSHAYSQPGAYTATLRIMDSAGRVGEAQLGIEVTSNAPVISIWLTKSNDISVTQGTSGYSTIGVYTSAPAAAALSLQWMGAVPASSSVSLSKTSGATNYSSTLVFSAGTGTPVGRFTLRVTASAGGVSGHLDVAIAVSQAYCTLTISAEPGGTTSPSPGSRRCIIGSVQQVVAEPSQGYEFQHWNLDGSYYSSATQISLFMEKSHSLRACFSESPPAFIESTTFEVMVWNGTGWEGGDFADWGAVAITGGAPSELFSDSPHSIPLASATLVRFQFVPICGNGSLLNETGGLPVSRLFELYVSNSSGTFQISPASASYPQSCCIEAGNAAVNVRLYLKSFDFDISVSSPMQDWGAVGVSSDSPGWPLYSAAYGSYMNGYGAYAVDVGHHITVNAEPFSGYYFDRIVVGNQTFYTPEVTLGPVMSNGSAVVYFSTTPASFALNISSTSGGSTLPSPGIYSVPRHSIQDVAIHHVEDGHSFAGWFLDGRYAGCSQSISVMMDNDHSLLAKFEDDYWDPDRINVRPCDLETGMMYRRLIAGECVGVNVSGRVSGITSPTPISVTVWFSDGSASYWRSTSGIGTDDEGRAKAEAMTDGSGSFSIVIGNLTGCWVISDLDPCSVHFVFAEVAAGGATHLSNGSWSAERISAHTIFSYNLSGALAAVSLTYSDGTPIEGRVGSYVVSINEIGIGFSSPNDRSGKCLLWIPYAAMESIPYIEGNWSISLFSNLSGSPSAVPSLLPSFIRFTAISGQFLMHNDTHLALQAFDWGSDRLEPVEGASTILWWGDERIWGGSDAEVIEINVSTSECVLVHGYDGSFAVSPDHLSWNIDASLNLGTGVGVLRGVILITHPSISVAISSSPSGCRLYLMLIPPDSSGVLYCPTRAGVFLLASSVSPPPGW